MIDTLLILVRSKGTPRLVRELLIVTAFVGLTILMTWPWVLYLANAASDSGDSYLNAWILWWDYYQTFRDPLNLFHANILYPYRYTLAFSENNYGIALPLFPLFAVGLRPLTVHSVATLVGFVLSGYGAFRLARTLTNSNGAAWIAGVAFGFVPYRFHHLPHVTYLSAGWIPLLLEALVLFIRNPTRRRASWLGVAFFMNALSSIHWFVLTLVPLVGTGTFIILRRERLRDLKLWRRGSIAIGLAALALLPFLIPYVRVAELYGLVRTGHEAAHYSASIIHWLTVDWQNKLWNGLGTGLGPYQTELALFPGVLPLICALAAFLLNTQRPHTTSRPGREVSLWHRPLLAVLCTLAVGAGFAALLTASRGNLGLSVPGQISTLYGSLTLLVIALIGVFLLVYREALHAGWRQLIATMCSSERSEALGIGALWVVTGFLGSFGMNLFFHRILFDFIPIFRSIRVPARWSMICYLGLALLAGIGATKIANLIKARQLRWVSATYVVIALLFLLEQRAAPLSLIRGVADPDELTLYLKETPMNGGIVELPAGVGHASYHYVLRAADHARPLVTGVSGFLPPIQVAIEEMSRSRPVPDRFLDLLEAIPVSYVVIHNSALSHDERTATSDFLRRAVSAGRLRLIRRYGNSPATDDLYVITKTEG